MGIQTNYNGNTYYVNMILPDDAASPTTTIYFSLVDNACTEGDMAITLDPSVGIFNLGNFQNACTIYKAYDAATKIAGCLSLASAVLCGLSVPLTDGASVLFCTAVWDYAADKGAADCIKGVADSIADELNGNAVWIGFKTALAVQDDDFREILGNLIDVFCDKNLNPALQ